MSEIDRQSLTKRLDDSIEHFRVTALLGSRQCGKTTLARTFNVARGNYFDPEEFPLRAGMETLGYADIPEFRLP